MLVLNDSSGKWGIFKFLRLYTGRWEECLAGGSDDYVIRGTYSRCTYSLFYQRTNTNVAMSQLSTYRWVEENEKDGGGRGMNYNKRGGDRVCGTLLCSRVHPPHPADDSSSGQLSHLI